MAAWFLERIFDLLMALLIFAFALMRVLASGVHVGPRLAWVLAAGGRFAALAAWYCWLLLSLAPLRRAGPAAPVAVLRVLPEAVLRRSREAAVEAFMQGVESTRSDGALLLIFMYSVLEWTLIAACYWCLARSFECRIS